MVGSFYRFWIACAVVAISGAVHAFWFAPEAWDGVRAVSTQPGAIGMWDYLRGAMTLLPGLGLMALWEHSQQRTVEVVQMSQSQTPRQKSSQDEQAAA